MPASRHSRPSPFDRLIYARVSRIPRGFVSTYAEVARAAGCGSARAAGQALRRNPFAPKVPCHRVIRADLTIGGFQGGASGLAVKRKTALLSGEGVRFERGRLADPSRVYRFR